MSVENSRSLPWPPEPGGEFSITQFLEELARESDRAPAGEGGFVILVEIGGRGIDELLQLVERLSEIWQGQNHSSVVMDCHPAAPFTRELFEGEPEGFTEMLHYGVSPHRLARARQGVSGHWIPAGAPWSLPLDAPQEPQRSLKRLMAVADRVLLLASAGDEEGLLPALRECAHYRVILEQSSGAPLRPAAAKRDQVAEPAAEAVLASPREESREESAPPPASADGRSDESAGDLAEFSLDQSGPRRRLAWLWLLPLLAVVTFAWWWSRSGDESFGPRGVQVARQMDTPLTHLPEETGLPFHGGAEPVDSSLVTAGSGGAQPTQVAEAPADAAQDPVESARKPVEAVAAGPAPKQADSPVAEAVATPADGPAPGSPVDLRRRFESPSRWRSALDHSGAFLVHVESYRDSSLGAASAQRRGFAGVGFSLIPTRVEDDTWYRLCVGPFPRLQSAVAYRDSLLDQAGVDYCVISLDHAN